MSDFSIEECIRHLTAIRAKIQKEMPDIKMWQSVEKNIEEEAEITLLLAQGKPPAFGEVHILFMLSDVDELEVHLESTSFCTDEFPQITDPKSLTDLIGKIAKLTSQYVKIAITNAFCIDEGSVSTPPTEIKFVWEPDSFDSEGNKENGSKKLIANKDASNTEGDEMDDEEYHQIDEEEVAQVVYEKVIVLRKIIDLLMAQKDSAGKEQ